ncbi:MAG: pilin [Patescibacteria group bacterium]
MKKNTARILTLTLIAIALPLFVSAEIQYGLSAPLPGGSLATKTSPQIVDSFFAYVRLLFPFLLSIAVISALTMTVFGGIQYMASGGNPSKISEARGRIQNAVFGLGIAVFSVLILNTINPNLTKLQFGSYFKRVGQGYDYTIMTSTSADAPSCAGKIKGRCVSPNSSCLLNPADGNYNCAPDAVFGDMGKEGKPCRPPSYGECDGNLVCRNFQCIRPENAEATPSSFKVCGPTVASHGRSLCIQATNTSPQAFDEAKRNGLLCGTNADCR